MMALAFAFRPAARLLDRPLTEDGFYAMSVARQLSQGNGLTIDGVHWTNGFQPLWVFVAAPLYALGRAIGVAPERFVIAAQALIYLLASLTLATVVRRAVKSRDSDAAPERLAGACAAFLFLAAPLTFTHCLNGLETGLMLLMLALTLRAAQCVDPMSPRGAAAIGAMLGLCVLTRIDAALLVAAAVAARLFVPGRRRWAAAVALGIAAVAVSSPWWIYNKTQFGAFMPVSGTSQQDVRLDPGRLLLGLDAAIGVLGPWTFSGSLTGLKWRLIRLAIFAALLLMAWKLRRDVRETFEWRGDGTSRRWFGLTAVLFACGLFAFYTGTSFAWWFYDRYFAPFILLGAGVAGVYLARFLLRSPRAPALAMCTLLSAALLTAVGVKAATYWGLRGDGTPVSEYLADQLSLVQRHVPSDEVVSAWQAGTLGYARAHVVNLDGKVNAEALNHRGNMPAYMASQGLRWFCDWQWCVQRCLGKQPEQNGWRLIARSHAFQLWHRP